LWTNGLGQVLWSKAQTLNPDPKPKPKIQTKNPNQKPKPKQQAGCTGEISRGAPPEGREEIPPRTPPYRGHRDTTRTLTAFGLSSGAHALFSALKLLLWGSVAGQIGQIAGLLFWAKDLGSIWVAIAYSAIH
jgi:hypothetical protein